MKQKTYKLSFLLQFKFELWICSNIRRCFFDSPYHLFKALPLRTRDKSFFFTDSSKHLPDSASIACMAPPITKHFFCASLYLEQELASCFQQKCSSFVFSVLDTPCIWIRAPIAHRHHRFTFLCQFHGNFMGKTKTISSLFHSSNFQNRDQFPTSTRKST